MIRSRIGTVVVVAITVNASRVLTLDRRFLAERAGAAPAAVLAEVDAGLRLVLAP